MKNSVRLLASVLVVASIGASCGSSSTPSDSTAGSSTLPPVLGAELSIVVGTVDEPTITEATLAVSADGVVTGAGFLADPTAAAKAAALLDNPAVVKRLVDGVPAGQMCTEMYGGPDTATITGTLRGATVKQSFNRADGCGIADWELLTPMLGRSHWDGTYRVYRRDEGPVSVKVGSGFTIELDSNATTGYQWEVKPLDDGVVSAGGHVYLDPATGAVGAGGWEQFQFTAAAAGTTRVTLEYRRPFEPATTPAVDTVTFEVTVTA
jgi:hypothetical protein